MQGSGFGSGSGSGSGSGYQSYIPPTPEIDYGVTLPSTISPQPAIDQASTTLASIQSAVNAAIQNCIANPKSVQGQVDACVSMVVKQAIGDNSVFLNSLGGLAQTAISNLYNAAQEYAMPFLSGQKTAIATNTPTAVPPTQTQSTSGERIGAAFYWGGPGGFNSNVVHDNFNPNSPAGYYYWNGSEWTSTPIVLNDAPTSGPSGPMPQPPVISPDAVQAIQPPQVNVAPPPSTSPPASNQQGLFFPPGAICVPGPSGSPGGWTVIPAGSSSGYTVGYFTDYAAAQQAAKDLVNINGIGTVVPVCKEPSPTTIPQPPPQPINTPCPPVPVVKVETCRTYDLITDIIRGQLATEKDILTAYMGGVVGALLSSATLQQADDAIYKLTPHLDPADIVPSNPTDLVSLTIEG